MVYKFIVSTLRRTAITVFTGKAALAFWALVLAFLGAFSLGKQEVRREYTEADNKFAVTMAISNAGRNKIKKYVRELNIVDLSYVYFGVSTPTASHDDFRPVTWKLSTLRPPEGAEKQFDAVAAFDKSGIAIVHAALHGEFACNWWPINELPQSIYMNIFKNMGAKSLIACPLYESPRAASPTGFTLAASIQPRPSKADMRTASRLQQEIVVQGLGGRL